MSLRVLLTNADTLLLSLYRAFLVDQQIEIRTAATGPACVDLLRRWRPDVLVLDADLPWDADRGVLDLMREASNGPVVAVLLLVAESAIASEAALIHDCVVLLKPVPTAVLVNSIRDLVRANGEERRSFVGKRAARETTTRGESLRFP